jgi:uncharacterized protein (TIGR03032 family)
MHRRAYQRVTAEVKGSLQVTGDSGKIESGTSLFRVVEQSIAQPALGRSVTFAERRPAEASPSKPAIAEGAPARFDRPVFVVSSPRAGSTLLFETLAEAPGLFTLGGENHAIFEGIPSLDPRRRGFDSNRQTERDADPATAGALCTAFARAFRDREGAPVPADAGAVRMLEKTPKNALRVPFLDAAFPDAVFVYLYRDPRETLGSMIDAWRSGRFVTYRELPGWSGPPWSLLLVPGWRDLIGKDLAEIVARQWAIATECLIADLERLPPERVLAVRYDALVADPEGAMRELTARLGLGWDRDIKGPLPASRYTLTAPAKDKWRKHAEALERVLPLIEATDEKARALVERIGAQPVAKPSAKPAPAAKPAVRPAPAPAVKPPAPAAPAPTSPAQQPLRSVHTQNLPGLFHQLGLSLLVTTYQSGHLIAVRADGDKLNTHFRTFKSPMGLALSPKGFALGTADSVWIYRNQRSAAPRVEPPKPYDAVFLPHACHVTGDIRIHDLAYGKDDLWIVNTKFSCLSTLDRDHSFVPRWRPPFVTGLAAEDRCHLNGMAMLDGEPRYVTALGTTDTAAGWRAERAHGGVILEVPSGRVVAEGLSMPHSPRMYRGALYFLESGEGSLARVDPATGKVETLVRLPGFTRGLAFAGPLAFIGLSQVRETNIFGGIPLTERVKERVSGVWVVNIETQKVVGFLRFEGQVQEIFDVQVLGARMPDIVEQGSALSGSVFVVPQEALEPAKAGA